ncbi:MAG: hypothetical protein HQK79_00270 [Desulfobacterales bacterium]|nr:hypothetical protein [Desulfobacterales bacterium]
MNIKSGVKAGGDVPKTGKGPCPIAGSTYTGAYGDIKFFISPKGYKYRCKNAKVYDI